MLEISFFFMEFQYWNDFKNIFYNVAIIQMNINVEKNMLCLFKTTVLKNESKQCIIIILISNFNIVKSPDISGERERER